MTNEKISKAQISSEEERLEKIRDNWNKKRSRELNSTRIVREKNQSEIKKVNEWTKHKVVSPDHDEKWNDRCPKMYFRGYNRQKISI
jgi:hypothetical protein